MSVRIATAAFIKLGLIADAYEEPGTRRSNGEPSHGNRPVPMREPRSPCGFVGNGRQRSRVATFLRQEADWITSMRAVTLSG